MARPSPATEKALCLLSDNRCAFPGCHQRLTHRSEVSGKTAVVGEICHIHAQKPGQARWNPELTEAEIHDIKNLILLCPTHHTIVDKQGDSYTADHLRQWKREREHEESTRLAGNVEASSAGSSPAPRFPTRLVDEQIDSELTIIRAGRFLQDFDTAPRCLQLGTSLTDGDYSGGTKEVRARALAWCARLLTRTEDLETAKEYLEQAKRLSAEEEITIASALVCSHEGDHRAALRVLDGLDSPMARSAALVVAADRDGPAGAVRWANEAGLIAADLDPDGKILLLAWLLELGDWDAAFSALDAVADDDRAIAPALSRVTALAHLLQAVSTQLRGTVAQDVPFFASDFPLAADREALRARSRARRHFRDAAKAARGLGCAMTAETCEEFALWLELLDLGQRNEARVELELKLQDPSANLRFVRLGLQFGVPLDIAGVEREIRREVARNGASTLGSAIARLAIALKKETAGGFADYVARHRQELVDHVDDRMLRSLEIDALARAGRLNEARSNLSKLVGEGLAAAEADRLRDAIAKAEGSDTTASSRRRFEETGSLTDLVNFVEELAAQGAPEDYYKYSALLFQRTRSREHAEQVANALMRAQDYPGLTAFLGANAEQVEQSKALQLFSCWSLFWQGSLLEARRALDSFSGDQNQSDYRNLQVQLAVSLGDWESASAIVETEYQARERRSGRELLSAAHLAAALGSPRAKELASAAAERAEDDADFFLALHMMAVKGGWDNEQEPVVWLHRAAALSGPDGPVQNLPLATLVKEGPRWRESRVNVIEKLDRGEIPAFVAAGFLNCALSDLMLRPAIANLSEEDPRRRRCVPAYSGKRPQLRCKAASRAGFDATTLLTLGHLDLLDKGLDVFDAVHLPHSTLTWLLHEKVEAAFHQPSQVEDARLVRNLLDEETIVEAPPNGSPNRELVSRIGPELASLIAEAETADPAGRQRLVVRPFPVHRVGSLMDEPVDLSAHYRVLTGCEAIVESLHRQGLLTEDRCQAAVSYLRLQERPWPEQPEISTSAVLYLDGLAMTYFLRLGLLGVLRSGGFTVYIPPGAVRQMDELVSYERASSDVQEILERIRIALRSRIESGRVRIGPLRPPEAVDGVAHARHPTMEAIGLADRADVIVSDDRFVSGYPRIGQGDGSARTATTLDLLDTLASTGAMSEADRQRYRTRLRRAAYLFVPVEKDELLSHLLKATLEEGRVIETAELRALRENVLLARMGNHLQLPDESQWLGDTIGAFVAALKDLWRGDPDVAAARLRSDWILEQIDLRGWTHRLPPNGASRTMDGDRAEQLIRLALAPPEASATVSGLYWDWVEERLLKPIQATEPALYSWLAERFLLTVSRVADKAAENPEPDDD